MLNNLKLENENTNEINGKFYGYRNSNHITTNKFVEKLTSELTGRFIMKSLMR